MHAAIRFLRGMCVQVPIGLSMQWICEGRFLQRTGKDRWHECRSLQMPDGQWAFIHDPSQGHEEQCMCYKVHLRAEAMGAVGM